MKSALQIIYETGCRNIDATIDRVLCEWELKPYCNGINDDTAAIQAMLDKTIAYKPMDEQMCEASNWEEKAPYDPWHALREASVNRQLEGLIAHDNRHSNLMGGGQASAGKSIGPFDGVFDCYF